MGTGRPAFGVRPGNGGRARVRAHPVPQLVAAGHRHRGDRQCCGGLDPRLGGLLRGHCHRCPDRARRRHGGLGGGDRGPWLDRPRPSPAAGRGARRIPGLTGERGPTGPLPLVAEGIRFTYAGATRPALQGIDLRLDAGGVLVVVGPSGSGKSTLARAVAGLVPRDVPGEWAGSLRIGDVEVSTASPAQVASRVGVLFQDPGSQLVMDRAEDDVAFGLENRAWAWPAMRARVPEALSTVGLGGFDRRRGSRLSGGQQQRLALAGVEAPRPSVLVLDEPTANLDEEAAAALFERLALIRGERSATIVLVEHRADLSWPLADLVLALDELGTPIDVGPPAEVLARSGTRLAGAGIWLPDDLVEPPPARWRKTVVAPIRAAGPDVVRAHHLRFEFVPGVPAVRDVELGIAGGERVALVGPNGSGKSTLLRLVAGLLRPGHGSVRLDGVDPARLKSAGLAAMAGYVFQDPELGFLADTVAEEVRLGLDPASVDRSAALMDRLGLPLEAFGARSPYRLSGGEQRRLSMATALARRPRLLLLDEPTFGQDRRGWESLAEIITELVGAGTAVLAATHDPRFAARVADRRIEMDDGWIVADDGQGRFPAEPFRSDAT
ncbi:MAG: ATP-binding cassette domain-containing protein [Chloroflexi bacterium]|nr:ATP-binding cassette domain-containing protein [Chloroflexota bacterium]